MPAEFSNPATTGIPHKPGAFVRFLHQTYHRGSGIHHFAIRRLRPAGIALGIAFVVAACLGIAHDRGPIYQMFSLCVVLGLAGLPWAMLRRAHLSAVREVPRHATAGQPLRYSVMVRNVGTHALTRAWLAESPPDPRPDLTEFSLLREPGEEERNGFDRTFAYFRWQWLLLRGRMFADCSSPEEIHLKPGEQGRYFVEFTPLRRGVIQLRDLRALLPDPCGLFQKCVKVSAPPATVMVLPKRFPLPPIHLPGGAAFKISGETTTNRIGNSGEFVGLRDYRPGDPVRLIHWKSWARAGRPVVKELEDTFYPRYGLVLDTLSVDRTDVRFEEAVSVAASFVSAIDTNDSLLDLMFVKNQAHLVTAGRGVERAEKLMEVLAAVTPERGGDFEELGSLVLRHRDKLTSCLVILNGWDESRADLLRTLEHGGVCCVPIIIGSGSPPAGCSGHWLRSGRIPDDLKRLPEQLLVREWP